jgi:CBS domain-containing protein
MNAADVMSRAPVRMTADATIAVAAELMLQLCISGPLVIEDNGEIAGAVPEGDLLRRVQTGTQRHRSRWVEFLRGPGRLADDYVEARARKVGAMMTTDVAVAAPQDDLGAIVDLMEKRRIKRVPISPRRGDDRPVKRRSISTFSPSEPGRSRADRRRRA